MRKGIVILLLSLLPLGVWAQSDARIDFLVGANLSYRDIHWNKLMEVLVNVTPAVKMQWGDGWQLAIQAIVPVYNEYGAYYSKVRLGIASASKEFRWNNNHFKVSGGMFSTERYGLDVKWMLPLKKWLAFDAQLGYTGFWSAQRWIFSTPDRLTGWAGVRVWLDKWSTEGRIRVGRFAYADYGVVGEGFRHFRHCSVGVYGQYGDKGGAGAGFKVVMMLPPYKRTERQVAFRPSSYFRLGHNVIADPYSLKMYDTDPEENEREGVFTNASWGPYSLPR